MEEFKIGDRVRVKENYKDYDCVERHLAGKTGRVVHNGVCFVGVEFDCYCVGHDCCGKAKYGYGWNIIPKYLELISHATPAQKILITHDGKTTTARRYEGNKVVDKKTAVCNVEDKFVFETGAEIAFNRLIGKDKPFDWEAFKTGGIVAHGVTKNGDKIEITKGATDSLSKPAEPKYKVGDIVTIMGNTNRHRFKIGENVRLVNLLSDGEYKAEHLDGHNWWYVKESDIKPCEKKQEPKRFYCIKDYRSIVTNSIELLKGKIYNFNGGFKYDDGLYDESNYKDWEEYKVCNPSYAACLVPLVDRPAKVGEWVYIKKDCGYSGEKYRTGEIHCVENVFVFYGYVFFDCGGAGCHWGEYLVLDGYKGE